MSTPSEASDGRVFTTVPPPDRGSGSFKDETRREMREKRWDEGSDS